MRRHWNNLRAALMTVFARLSYLAAAVVLAAAALLLAIWFPNLGLIGTVLGDRSLPLTTRLGFPLGLLRGFATNFGILSGGYTVAIAVLFGVNTAMIAYQLR